MDEKEAGEEKNSRPILGRLSAALFQTFRGQHSEKMVCIRRVPGVTGTLGKTNSHLDPMAKRVEDRTTTLRRLLIGALIQLVHWSEDWCFPLNPSKCKASFSVDLYQANLKPLLLLINSALHFNHTPIFLAVTFDRTFSFSKHISSLR